VRFGDPNTAMSVAASRGGFPPNTQPVGGYTGAPPPTTLQTINVPAQGPSVPAVCVVPDGRANRFVTLTAPRLSGPFVVYVGMTENVTSSNGIALPPGQPYEITLPGNQSLWAVTSAPTAARLTVQIAVAVTGDRERTLG
jgi:hypothetical protein